MSLGLGLRAKELTSLRWADVYDAGGRVRPVLHLRAAYTKGGKTRDVYLSSPALRRALSKYAEGRFVSAERATHAPLFPSQKGGPMTPASMARFLKGLYSEAGIVARRRIAAGGR